MSDRPVQNAQLVLREIARRVMIARGLEPEFSAAALNEADRLRAPAPGLATGARDLRTLRWCSIDNDDSRDLDQLSVAEPRSGNGVRLRIAVADVGVLVQQASALDQHAQRNTTSVYTPAQVFPMLPERLSTDLTSLNPQVERLAFVIDMQLSEEGTLESAEVYSAWVFNHVQLTYDRVGAWLEGRTPVPGEVAAVDGLAENLQLQWTAAQRLKSLRHEQGALTFETLKARPVFADGALRDVRADTKNAAKQLIEDLMIAANGVTARFLAARGFPSIRRVVRTPKQWDRIVELAAAHGATLPNDPDAQALERFLTTARQQNRAGFADLSLSVIKLMGAGEYAVEMPQGGHSGHFGLAVKDYAHSTAPNRRYPDLITQRLLRAALQNRPTPYSVGELQWLAEHCTEQEDAAKKVERHLVKSAAAMLLRSRIGEEFEALVTGAADKGTWVRVTAPLVEGKLVAGYQGRKVGQRLRVRLLQTDVERGLIDFAAAQL